MAEAEGRVTIEASPSSIVQGSHVEFIVRNLVLTEQTDASISVSKVESDYTEFSASSGGLIFAADQHNITVSFPYSEQLEPGLYIVTSIGFKKTNPVGHPSDEIRLISPQDFDVCLFEVREATSEPRTAEDLILDYQQILIAREQEFIGGFGDMEGAQDKNGYKGLVFVKDCLIRNPMRLGAYEIIPFNGLACNDELNLIQGFLAQAKLGTLTNVQAVLEEAQMGQPTMVVHFPKVIAETVEKAGEIIEDEVRQLGNLLSLHRLSYASIFGVVLWDLPNGRIAFKIEVPSYRGNLIGGSLSGEDPPLIKKRMNNLRGNIQLQLYIALYREALSESRLELAYFRFWNLLETIARSKNYIGHPLRDWQGNIMLNRRGQQRFIQDDAEELVNELLRDVFTTNNYSDSTFSGNLHQGLVSQQIPIWYRHRNCMVHSGGCFPNDQAHCDQTKTKFTNCKLAHDEIIAASGTRNRFTDYYFLALGKATRIVIESELL